MENIDLLIKGWYVVTMNETRDIISDGAVAIRGNTIVDVGKASDLEQRYTAAETIGGDRFVVTPGMINSHIHVTGEPLTRGYVPDDTPFEENVFMWLCPLYSVYTAEEERVSGQLASVEMLKSGTTTFLEAGTIRFLDEVVDGLTEVGMRGRVGNGGLGSPARTRRLQAGHRRVHRHPGSAARGVPRGPEDLHQRVPRSSSATPPRRTRCGSAARELATEHGVGHELPHVARPSSIPRASSPSSAIAR